LFSNAYIFKQIKAGYKKVQLCSRKRDLNEIRTDNSMSWNMPLVICTSSLGLTLSNVPEIKTITLSS